MSSENHRITATGHPTIKSRRNIQEINTAKQELFYKTTTAICLPISRHRIE